MLSRAGHTELDLHVVPAPAALPRRREGEALLSAAGARVHDPLPLDAQRQALDGGRTRAPEGELRAGPAGQGGVEPLPAAQGTTP